VPEGDTVHKLAEYLSRYLPGRVAARVVLLGRPSNLLTGALITAVTALGKHLLIDFGNGQTLRSHLGMHGSWHRYPEGSSASGGRGREQRRPSIELTVEGEVFVCFNAMEVEILPSDGVRHRALRQHLGPDLLAEETAPAQADTALELMAQRARALCPPTRLLVDILLDQRLAAGIGNVYKSEVLFLERIAPSRRLDDTTAAGLAGLFARAGSLLAANVHGGARTTRPHADGAGRLWVYGRRNLPCHVCRTPVRGARLGNPPRATFWCPSCQPR
jgi:endonuclease-8